MSDNDQHTVVIGITGGIACGKSEVGRVLGECGFPVCDADHVAHRLMRKGTPVFRQTVNCFGEQILAEDGEIARPVLGKMVFENPTRRQELDRIVHPAVREALSMWIAERRSRREPAAVLIPLLFESGMDTLDWDAVWCVSSDEKQVFQRLEKRGLSTREAALRVRAQMPLAEKEKLADRVIPNLGTLNDLESAVRQAVKETAARKE